MLRKLVQACRLHGADLWPRHLLEGTCFRVRYMERQGDVGKCKKAQKHTKAWLLMQGNMAGVRDAGKIWEGEIGNN